MANFGAIPLLVGICLVYLFTNGNTLASSFKVERNDQDTFQNPDCLTTEANSTCSAKSCERYNAGCPYRSCKSCVCYGSYDTFSFPDGIHGKSTGKCMDTEQMANFPGTHVKNLTACQQGLLPVVITMLMRPTVAQQIVKQFG